MANMNRCGSDKTTLKVVGIGGGTGLSVLLNGLKRYTSNITAIVSVADDGGSSGRLRGELGILPPGDIRDCLVSLSPGKTLLEKLVQYRFSGGELNGHNLGNLLMAALCDLTGGFAGAIDEMGRLLNISGKVLPVTLDRVVLGAKMEDDTIAYGQSLIPLRGGRIKEVFLDPPDCRPTRGVISAIGEADIIVIGPGSLYTSIIPGLLVEGVAGAVRQSGALRLYICNIVTQPGETDGYAASDHVRGLRAHAGKIEDFVLVNTAAVDKTLDDRLGKEILPVIPDLAELERLGAQPKGFDFVDRDKFSCHHSQKLAEAIFDLYTRL